MDRRLGGHAVVALLAVCIQVVREDAPAARYQGVHCFTDLAHGERELAVFIERYNREWFVERHDHCTPRAIRAELQGPRNEDRELSSEPGPLQA